MSLYAMLLLILSVTGFLHCVQLLLKYNADATLKNKHGKRASFYVDNSQGRGCQRLLLQAEGIFPATNIELTIADGLRERRVKEGGRWKTEVYKVESSSTVVVKQSSRFHREPKQVEKNLEPASTATISRPIKWLSPSSSAQLSVLSYNILAEGYTRPSFFPYATADGIVSCT